MADLNGAERATLRWRFLDVLHSLERLRQEVRDLRIEDDAVDTLKLIEQRVEKMRDELCGRD